MISSMWAPVTMCSLRFSAVTFVIASATAELTLPVTKSTRSRSISSRVFSTPAVMSLAELATNSSTGRPRTPPP